MTSKRKWERIASDLGNAYIESRSEVTKLEMQLMAVRAENRRLTDHTDVLEGECKFLRAWMRNSTPNPGSYTIEGEPA